MANNQPITGVIPPNFTESTINEAAQLLIDGELQMPIMAFIKEMARPETGYNLCDLMAVCSLRPGLATYVGNTCVRRIDGCDLDAIRCFAVDDMPTQRSLSHFGSFIAQVMDAPNQFTAIVLGSFTVAQTDE